MLVNLNNSECINTDNIVSISVYYTVEKPNLLTNVDKAMVIWMEEKDNYYFRQCKNNYDLCIVKWLEICLTNGRTISTICKVDKINFEDFNIDFKVDRDYYVLFYATMKLDPSEFKEQVIDFVLMNYINKLLNNETEVSRMPFTEHIDNYHKSLDCDKIADKIKKEVIEWLELKYNAER